MFKRDLLVQVEARDGMSGANRLGVGRPSIDSRGSRLEVGKGDRYRETRLGIATHPADDEERRCADEKDESEYTADDTTNESSFVRA